MARTPAGSPLEDALPRLVDAHVVDAVERGIEQVDDAADGVEHARIVPHSMRGRKGRPGAAVSARAIPRLMGSSAEQLTSSQPVAVSCWARGDRPS